MSADYAAIRQNNIKEYGQGTRHLSYFADIYTRRTHFIFEVLQNAEDALSRRLAGSPAGYVHFHLHSDRLEIRHNGAPFDGFDVTGICGIGEGTKAEDFTQIGKFGIGFKSVYAYTFFPQIHSGNEHFEIQRFVEPHEITPRKITDVEGKDTLIVLPFDQPNKRPGWAFRGDVSATDAVREIGDALRKLGIHTLLFLRHIAEIKWTLQDGTSGYFARNTELITGNACLRKVRVLDQDYCIEEWWIFSREVAVQDAVQSHQVTVEIAFLIKDGAVTRADNTELVVFFPTEKKTELGFLIQAPFKATKGRDNIKSDDPANHQMIKAAAQLAADSLNDLGNHKLLNVESFNALPLREQDFPESSLFRPVYDRVREALKTQLLLPAHGGGFIKADEAKLARGEKLVGLFSQEQLGSLFGKKNLAWLDEDITADKYPDFYAYIVGLAEGMLITPESLSPKLTAEFLGKQPMDWLIKFIQYAMLGAQSLKKVPFIRLSSGKHVSLFPEKNARPSAWFAPKDTAGIDLSVFPLVHAELAANEPIRKFLEKENIRPIDAAAIVGQCILPLYQGENKFFNESNYREHLRQIRKAYTEANDASKKQLTTSLNGVEWLACIHASGNAPDNIVWKKPRASDVFERTIEHETWFSGLDSVSAYFLHPSVKAEFNGVVSSVVEPAAELTQNLHPWEGTVPLYTSYGWHKQGLKGFRPDATVVGLQPALDSWSKERASILWNIMLSAPRIISGEIQQSSNLQKLDAGTKEFKYTEVGNLCRKYDWLPDKTDHCRKPDELFLTDLPVAFDTFSISAREVAEKLGMKKPEVEQALDLVTKGDDDLKKLIAAYQSGSNADREKLRKMIPQELSPQHAPSFKDGLAEMTRPQRGTSSHGDVNNPHNSPVSNPGRYQDKLSQAVADGVLEHDASPKVIHFSPVRDQLSNKEARQTLYEEYQGRCQVTGETFPKASANANGEAANYFEVCSLLPYGNADYLNDAGNMLCVSADTMAKLNHASFEWLDDIEHKIAEFDNGGETAQEIKIRIRLADEECTIAWSQRHFMQLVALYQRA